jgi:hypothetical protein
MNKTHKTPRARKATTKAPAKHPGGRPSAFKPAYVVQANKLALLGQTDAEMAEFFDVAESTFHLWKLKHPEFSESLRAGKEVADSEIAKALYHAALGGVIVTETREQTNAEGKTIMRAKEVKELPPNVTAMGIWLKCRKPEVWRDRVAVDANVMGPDVAELDRFYEETMRLARERQRAVLVERGLLNADGEIISEV